MAEVENLFPDPVADSSGSIAPETRRVSGPSQQAIRRSLPTEGDDRLERYLELDRQLSERIRPVSDVVSAPTRRGASGLVQAASRRPSPAEGADRHAVALVALSTVFAALPLSVLPGPTPGLAWAFSALPLLLPVFPGFRRTPIGFSDLLAVGAVGSLLALIAAIHMALPTWMPVALVPAMLVVGIAALALPTVLLAWREDVGPRDVATLRCTGCILLAIGHRLGAG